MKCICGKDIDCTSAIPWMVATYNTQGEVIRGTCLHGISFNFEDFALGVVVKITEGFWNGGVGPIRYRSPSGEFGIELTTADYGKVIVWVGKEGIKRYACC